jgi:chromosome segregation ATPase
VVQAIEEKKVDGQPLFCGVMEDLTPIGEVEPCQGRLIEFKVSEFPANAEIINMITDLSTKLAFSSVEIQNLTRQKEAAQDEMINLQNTIEELMRDKAEIEADRRRLKSNTEALEIAAKVQEEKIEDLQGQIIEINERS